MKVLICMLLVLVGCTEKVSFETTEDARRQARENATMVATDFRRQNPQYTALDLFMRGDSTIADTCPQGDGWASVDLRDKAGATNVKLKCSTVSMSIGCLEENDFKGKAYASEEGRCNQSIPHPIPKLAK